MTTLRQHLPSEPTAVIFLDMDGVIATARAHRAQRDRPLPDRWIDGEAMGHLNALCQASGAPVVISSTWRLDTSVGEFLAIVRRNGFTGQMHRDWRTKSLNRPIGSLIAAKSRGDEVQEWMSRHPEVMAHVILDDDQDFYPHQPLVHTEFECGLTAADVVEAKRLLDVQESGGLHVALVKSPKHLPRFTQAVQEAGGLHVAAVGDTFPTGGGFVSVMAENRPGGTTEIRVVIPADIDDEGRKRVAAFLRHHADNLTQGESASTSPQDQQPKEGGDSPHE